MAPLIDPAPRPRWQEFLDWFRSQPQGDRGVQAEIRNAEGLLANSERDDQNEAEGARQQVRQLIKQALEKPTAQNLVDYLTFTT